MFRSRSIFPDWTCCITAVQVNSFEIEPRAKERHIGCDRFARLDVREAVAVGEEDLSILHDDDDRPGNVFASQLKGQGTVHECTHILRGHCCRRSHRLGGAGELAILWG